MESTRRLVIAAALGLVVLALAAGSDFLLGSFWGSHAMLTSLIASLLVLAVTVVVLNELLARRDRRRWSVLAQHVLFQLVQSARATWMGLVELVHDHEIETGSSEGLLAGAQLALDTPAFSAATRTMLADAERRRVLQEMLVALADHSRGVIASWAAVMIGAGPYAEVFDRHVELQGRVDWISDVLAHNEPNEQRSLVRRKLVRSSLAAEHVAILEPDWVHDQIVSTAQLAVRLDYESRALGFRLVPYEEWVKRIHTFVDEPPTLND